MNYELIQHDQDKREKPRVVFLLAVWGEAYIRQFFELGIKSLLAAGNIPAMAAEYDCSFTFLTCPKDKPHFDKHPLLKTLEAHCSVTFITIDDLLFGENYSATLTIAYERGMRHEGERMLDTYFIFLVSDYIMADGSLKGLIPYLKKGYSGVTAGNFQVIEETFQPKLEALAAGSDTLSIPPRELVAQALDALHPITVANTVNQLFCHTIHTNRLFWRADNDTLIGRFYLRHMLCIRPETDEYVLGASCDYSYIPEMCPSGNIAHIQDSDEYCVIELQPADHEKRFLAPGPLTQEMIVTSLGEWATEQHRANAHVPVIFHAGPVSAAALQLVEESKAYVEAVERQLPPAPVPYRAHPYWISCIECSLQNLLSSGKPLARYWENDLFAGILGSPVFGPPLNASHCDYIMLRTNRLYFSGWRHRINAEINSLLGGTRLKPTILHPYWHDYRAICAELEKALRRPSDMLFISNSQTWLADWLHARGGDRVLFQQALLFTRRADELLAQSISERCQTAYIFLLDNQTHMLTDILTKCRRLLPEGSTIGVFIVRYNDRLEFDGMLQGIAQTAQLPEMGHISQQYMITTPLRRFTDVVFLRSIWFITAKRSSLLKRLAAVGVISATSLLQGGLNLLRFTGVKTLRSHTTSAILVLKNQRVAKATETGAPYPQAAEA